MKILIFFLLSSILCSEAIDSSSVQNVTSKVQLDKILEQSYSSYLTIFYHPSSPVSIAVSPIFSHVSTKLEHLIGFLRIDCSSVASEFPDECADSTTDTFVRIRVYRAPVYKYNPYTKKLSEHVPLNYNVKEITEKLLYNFAVNGIEQRAVKVHSGNFDKFLDDHKKNKALLVTNKQDPLIWKGLSNFFGGSLVLGEAKSDEKKLLAQLDIKEFPTVVAFRIYDEYGQRLPLYETVTYKGPVKAGALVDFLKTFEIQDTLGEVAIFNLNSTNYEKFINSKSIYNIVIYGKSDKPIDTKIIDFVSRARPLLLFAEIDCATENKTCDKLFKSKQRPALSIFRDNVTDLEMRIKQSVELSHTFYDFSNDLNDIFVSNIKETTDQTFSSMIHSAAHAKKTPIVYFFKEDQMSLIFKISSALSKYNQTLEFLAFSNPSKQLLHQMQITKLPTVGGVIANLSEVEKSQMSFLNGELTTANFMPFLDQMKIISGKIFEEEEEPEVKISKNEITMINSQQTFDELCKSSKRACVLGLFDGRERNKSSFEQNVEKLRAVHKVNDNKPFNFHYVNATCHVA